MSANSNPENVHLYTSPWVSGTRAEAYFGVMNSSIEYEKSNELEDAFIRVFENLQTDCAKLGGNAVVGLEVCIDPFATPPYIRLTGTGALLVPLFT